MRAPSLGQVGSFACWGRFWLSPCRLCQALLSAPPLRWSVFGPSSVRFFFSLALSGFARFGLGVLVLVFSLFTLLFCVPHLVSRLGSCHLMSIVISFPFPFHLHLHLTCRSLKKPRCCGACVWTIWRDVKLLSFAGGPWALGWHGPTKNHPSCCANRPAIFWIVMGRG